MLLEEQMENKVVDFKFAVELMNGNESIVHDILKMLVDSFPEELRELDVAREKEDWECVRAIAHKLKGGSSYCGTMRLKDVSTALDRAVKDNQKELFVDLYQKLITEIHAVEEVVKNKSYEE